MSKALIVSHTAEKGGAELFLIDLVKYGPSNWAACFLSDGPAVQTLTAIDKAPIIIKAPSEFLDLERGSTLFTALFGFARATLTIFALCIKAKQYDVIIANSQKSFLLCGIASILTRSPLVWVLHDIVSDASFGKASRKSIEILARSAATRIVANSRASARSLEYIDGVSDKISIVYNGFDEELASAEPMDVRKVFGFGPQPVIGLFGRLAEWKGQHVLLDALARTPGVQALIVGGALFGQEEYERRLLVQARDLGLEDRVRFLGFRDDVPQIMAGVDIVAHTSISPEPFGRVIVEGMLAKKPVIATGMGGVTEIISDGVNGLLIKPGDVEGLARAITTLTGDKCLSDRISEEGLRSAKLNFSIEKTIRDLAMVLDSAVGFARTAGRTSSIRNYQ